jgi:leucyl-tRNA synthetase
MELVNEMYACESKISPAAMSEAIEILTLMLAPFAPYLAQELWEEQGRHTPVFKESWPEVNYEHALVSEVEIVVQINGKVRLRTNVRAGMDSVDLAEFARDNAQIQALVAGKTVVKVIAVPDKLINLVVK